MKKPVYTTVYRMEHPIDNLGPYNSQFATEETSELLIEQSSDTRPMAWRDGIDEDYYTSDDIVFGFKSLTQLRTWFSDALNTLTTAGFRIVKYFVPKNAVKYGGHQVVFNRRMSIKPKNIHSQTNKTTKQ